MPIAWGLVFGLLAVGTSGTWEAADDSLSLLQTNTKRIQDVEQNPAVSISLDGTMQGPPPDCDPSLRMNMEQASVAYSNLGRMGPDHDGPEGILFTNVVAESGKNIDLLVSALSAYTPKKVEGNGKGNGFGRINIATGTSLTVEFSFREGGTSTPVLMNPFTMSFVDLDEQRDEGMGRESITVMDEHEYILTNTSTILVSREDGQTTFSSSAYGSGQDNPKGAMELTKAQKDKTVQLVFPSTSSFSATLTAGPHPAHWSGSSRNILFAGQTNVWCLPDHPLAIRAPCESMECPLGYKLKKKKKLEGVFCEDEDCTVQADLGTCCQVDLCSKARLLTLGDDSIRQNNLGNQGPDSGPEGIVFENVFPHSGKSVNLLLSAEDGYQRGADRLNGARDNIARINLVTGGRADLTFNFVDATTNEPTNVGPFYMSFLDFDERQTAGIARESLTVSNFKKYVLDENTVVRAIPNDAAETTMIFHSTTFGEGEDNVVNTKAMTDAQKAKSVSVLMGKVKTFSASFGVAELPGNGFSNRYLQVAGATNLVC